MLSKTDVGEQNKIFNVMAWTYREIGCWPGPKTKRPLLSTRTDKIVWIIVKDTKTAWLPTPSENAEVNLDNLAKVFIPQLLVSFPSRSTESDKYRIYRDYFHSWHAPDTGYFSQ